MYLIVALAHQTIETKLFNTQTQLTTRSHYPSIAPPRPASLFIKLKRLLRDNELTTLPDGIFDELGQLDIL